MLDSKRFWVFMILGGLLVGYIKSYPLSYDDLSVVPVLSPPDSPVEQTEEKPTPTPSQEVDSAFPTEFPVLKPLEEDFVIVRPHPVEGDDNSEQKPSESESDFVVNRPTPTGVKLLGNELGGDDDTVVVEAASCEQLQQDCNNGDPLSCQAYNEHCDKSNGDDNEVDNFINCSGQIGAGSGSGKCPPIRN